MSKTTIGSRLQRIERILRLIRAAALAGESDYATVFVTKRDLVETVYDLASDATEELFWIREALPTKAAFLAAPTDDECEERRAQRKARSKTSAPLTTPDSAGVQ